MQQRRIFTDGMPFISLPPDEMAEHWRISSLLLSLAGTVQRVADALALVELSEAQMHQRTSNDARGFGLAWLKLAMREVLVAVWDFKETLHAIRAAIPSAPTIAATLTDSELASCVKQFQGDFPDALLLRNSAAHFEDQITRQKKHAFTGRVDALGIDVKDSTIQMINGRVWIVTYDGKTAQLRIDEAVLQKLVAIQQRIYGLIPTHHRAGKT